MCVKRTCVVMRDALGACGGEGGTGGAEALTQMVEWLFLPCEEKGQRGDVLREGRTDVTQVRGLREALRQAQGRNGV